MEIDIFITELKENYPLIKHFGPIYIDFDEYPRYSGRTSAIFETTINESIQCDHGYAYSSGKNKCAHGLIKKVGQ